MSWVANLMISVALPDTQELPGLNAWLQEEAPHRAASGDASLRGVGALIDQTGGDTTTWGGSKVPECNVWAGALNHADLPAILAKVEATPWQAPGAVQVFVMDQEETYFRLWMIRDGVMVQFAPERPLEREVNEMWVS